MINYKVLTTIFVVIAIVLAASTGYLIAFPPSSSSHVGAATTTTVSTLTTTITSTFPPTSSGQFTINLAYKAGIGFYLTNASGYTLYFRATDPGNGSSTCTGGCVSNWPLFNAGTGTLKVPSVLNTSSFGVATRADGQKQTTYNGYPLYYYVGDKSPGQITGQEKGNFYACCSVVTTTTSSATSSSSSNVSSAAVVQVQIPSGTSTNSSTQGNLGFYPNNITVIIGSNNTVMWMNNDITTHTITSS
ncbi:MAG: hypothetical protein ACREBS_10455, partial [Nitrososphaerales archaeon]